MNKTSKALGKEAKRHTVQKRATTRMQENCQQLTEIHRCQMATLIGNPIGNQIYDSRANKYAEIDVQTLLLTVFAPQAAAIADHPRPIPWQRRLSPCPQTKTYGPQVHGCD